MTIFTARESCASRIAGSKHPHPRIFVPTTYLGGVVKRCDCDLRLINLQSHSKVTWKTHYRHSRIQ
jgi:hypothetical protein